MTTHHQREHGDRHHGHPHEHPHEEHAPLKGALILTTLFAVLEAAGGWISGSLALLADAVHMFSDVAALALAALAHRIAARPAHAGMTYGYGRARVLAAQVNGLALLFLAGWIGWEAVGRLQSPPPVHGSLMLGVAFAGLLVNVVILRWLHGGHDINTRAAYWHVLGDLLGSVAAVLAGLTIVWTGWMPIDPLLSFVVTVILIWGGWRLVRDTTLQLMEGTPPDVDMRQIEQCMLAVEGVCGIHHVHVWLLPDSRAGLSAHVSVNDMRNWPSTLTCLLESLESSGVMHATLQPESAGLACADAVSHAGLRHP